MKLANPYKYPLQINGPPLSPGHGLWIFGFEHKVIFEKNSLFKNENCVNFLPKIFDLCLVGTYVVGKSWNWHILWPYIILKLVIYPKFS